MFLKFLSSFRVVLKDSEIFRLSSTRLLLKWFLIKKTVGQEVHRNIRSVLFKWEQM